MSYPPPQTKPVRRGPPKISRAGADVFAALAQQTKFVDPALAGHWPTIAGAQIAALCRPGRITGMRTGRTLEVHAPSGAAAAQLQMLLDDLKTRVNSYLGPGAVTHIAVRQSTAAPNPALTAATKDGDNPLGQALASFRAAVANRNGEK